MSITTLRDAKIRFYDGDTPYYLEMDLDAGDFSGPIGQPRQEEILILDRGEMSGDAHYIKGPDDKLMEPMTISFSVYVRDDAQFGYILDWLDAMNDGLTTTVNSNTLVSTEADSQRDGSNNNPTFADSNKGTSDVCYLIDTSGTDRGWRYYEVYFPLDQVSFTENEEGSQIAITGMVYGTVSRITEWPSGTSVEA